MLRTPVTIADGLLDRILKAGDIYLIPPEAEHSPSGDSEGARAIIFRVRVEGQEELILVE